MTIPRFSTSTTIAIIGVLALFSAAWCAEPQEIEAGTGAGSHAGYTRKVLTSGLDTPGSLVRGPRGNHYVAAHGAVFLIDPDGATVEIAHGLPAPLVLSMAQDGNLYAAAPTAGAIYRIAPNGCCTLEADGLAQPAGIAVDRDGNFTVGLATNGEVVTLLRSTKSQ